LTVDRESGTILGRVSRNLSLRTFSNIQSDRLYVCHETGLIQCLREPGRDRPMFHSGEITEIVRAETPAKTRTESSQDASNPFGDNPFGGGSAAPANNDPFSGGSAMPNNDPFSGGSSGGAANNDPFSGGASGGAANDDPFAGGGASNPPAGGNMQNNSDPFSGGAAGGSTGGSGATDDPFAGGASGGSTGGSGATDDPFAGGGSNMNNSASSGSSGAASNVTLWKDVQGIFKKRCGTCHGDRNPKGGFNTTSLADVMQGGDSGSPVTAGDAEGSRLYQLITHADEPKMPPNGNKIPDSELKQIEAWINGGALDKQPAASSGSGSGTDSSDPFAGGN
jgi:hypothetical protein